jgi:hypothetical protein
MSLRAARQRFVSKPDFVNRSGQDPVEHMSQHNTGRECSGNQPERRCHTWRKREECPENKNGKRDGGKIT